MKCPDCAQNGISPLQKSHLIFDTKVRCKLCGSLLYLHKGALWTITGAMNLSIMLVSVFAFTIRSVDMILLGAVITPLLAAVAALLCPMKVKSQIGAKRRTARRIAYARNKTK
ncbi:hypothetical protein CWB98_06810 [Pseudoalteromonas rubra]|uniref:Uncharacterized protein n=1 Tax=Pseudoalteromonas rubra TaxID=43658 RepID=A0A5S3X3T1_9GAMM|nr:hypothetical protein CWB98_06810 [Pseudoalteromonas rubra]